MSNLKEKLLDLGKAIQNLKDILKIEVNSVVRDATIKRFEICYDLFWKCLKHKILEMGVEANSPRQVFREAFRLEIILDLDNLFDMVDMRNNAVHSYDEKLADDICKKIPATVKLFEETFKKINT